MYRLGASPRLGNGSSTGFFHLATMPPRRNGILEPAPCTGRVQTVLAVFPFAGVACFPTPRAFQVFPINALVILRLNLSVAMRGLRVRRLCDSNKEQEGKRAAPQGGFQTPGQNYYAYYSFLAVCGLDEWPFTSITIASIPESPVFSGK